MISYHPNTIHREEATLLGQRCYQLAQAIFRSSIDHGGDELYVDDAAKQLIASVVHHRRYSMRLISAPSTLTLIMGRVSKWRDASFWDQFIKYAKWEKEIEQSNRDIDQMLQVYQVRLLDARECAS
jgi:hypothetical protein